MAWINTVTEGEIVLQRKNRLKGLALQAFVSKQIKKKYDADDLVGDEDTVGEIKKACQDALDNLFIAKKTLRIVDSHGNSKKYYPKSSNHYSHENQLVSLDDFKPPISIYRKKETSGSQLGYKGCKKCYFCLPEKFCKKCGGAYFDDRFKILNKLKEKYNPEKASELFFNRYPDEKAKYRNANIGKFLFNVKWIKESHWNEGKISSKIDENGWPGNEWCTCDNAIVEDNDRTYSIACPNCGSNHFDRLKPGFSINEFESVEENCSLSLAKEILKEESLVTKSSASGDFSKSRLDSWLVSEESSEIYIIETKNYEDTSLSSSDLYQALRYIEAIINSGAAKPKNADLIYNGTLSKGLKKQIKEFEDYIECNINLIGIKELCDDIGVFPNKIIISNRLNNAKFEYEEFDVTWELEFEEVESPVIQIEVEND